jgi:ATP-dependent RNA helicase DeaD
MSSNFESFNLDPELIRAVGDMAYETPTPIQVQTIPVLLEGRDVLGQAQTGTGKTAAFALPMLNNLTAGTQGVQGLIVEPTRELAIQVARAVRDYGQHRRVHVLAVYGGQAYDRQIRRLERGVDVVVGTPGRMLDLIRKQVLDLGSVRFVVLDEADQMLSMGFVEDMEAILQETPATRQTALFSATLPAPIRRLADRYMQNPVTVAINPDQVTVPETEQRYYMVNDSDKLAALTRLLETESPTRTLVFVRTKVGAAGLAEALFARGFQTEALHGDMVQSAREVVMGHFRDGKTPILIATDVAARGLDIQDVSHVINYDVPFDPEDYVHRIGRTGRAGKSGVAIMLLTPKERRRLRDIEAFTLQTIRKAEMPSVEEVVARRDARFTENLLTELSRLETRSVTLVEHLETLGFPPTEIAAAAMQFARTTLREPEVEPIAGVADLERARRDGPKRARGGDRKKSGVRQLAMDVGKVEGVRPRDVVGAIAGEANVPGRAVGAIEIQDHRTLVEVADRYADQVLAKMRRIRMRGHWVTLYEAR